MTVHAHLEDIRGQRGIEGPQLEEIGQAKELSALSLVPKDTREVATLPAPLQSCVGHLLNNQERKKERKEKKRERERERGGERKRERERERERGREKERERIHTIRCV